jgi:mannitol/fructose-specific phosphotransferase system IIA component (Ntr-type)
VERVRAVLGDLLVPQGVLELEGVPAKRDVVTRLGTAACDAAGVKPEHVRAVLDALWDREQILSTGIGLGIAVPHVRHANVAREIMRVGRCRKGLAFDAIDGKPVHAVFTILMPAGSHRRHVEVLGAIAAAVKDAARREGVFSAADSAQFVERLLSAP